MASIRCRSRKSSHPHRRRSNRTSSGGAFPHAAVAGDTIEKQAEGNAIYIADPQYLTSLRVIGSAFGPGSIGVPPVPSPPLFKRGNARSTFDAWTAAFGPVATAAGNVFQGGEGFQPASWTPPPDLPDVYAKFERLYPGASIRFDLSGKRLPTTGPRQIGASQE